MAMKQKSMKLFYILLIGGYRLQKASVFTLAIRLHACTTLEEAQTLIEGGFEYVTSVQTGQMNYKLFRKKKQWRPS
jgi:hypothetical protein